MRLVQTKAQAAAIGPEPLLLDLPTVMAMTGLGQKTIYQLMAVGFPKPKKVGDRAAKWYRPDLLSWIEKLPYAEYGLTKAGQLPRDPSTTGFGMLAAEGRHPAQVCTAGGAV